ncbi:MAG: cytochrome c3 family protein [Coriobacteriia bacterium]
MEDPEVALDDPSNEEFSGEDKKEKHQSKRWLLLLLLLLLLLCAVTTVVDTWVNQGPEQARFVTRNLECLQCHTELIPDFGKASVHNPFMLKECTVCHTRHGREVERTILSGIRRTWERARTLIRWLPLKWILGSFQGVAGATDSESSKVVSTTREQVKGAESYLVADIDELCWICHGDMGSMLQMDYPHNPFQKGYCTTCHDPHASDHGRLLVQEEKNLCVTCHPVASWMAKDQLHPPFEGRFCTNCHQPHASEWKGVLNNRQRDLCFMCHPSVALLSSKAYQHNPFEYDNCTGCHDPHSANYEPLLLADQSNVCYACHPEIQRDFLKASHHPVGTVKLECADCHNPHAADHGALIVAEDNALCYKCHATAIQATYDPSGHGTAKVLCIGCHTPHGSLYEPILRNSNPDLCLACHPARRYDGRNTHPVRPVSYDMLARRGINCTTSCHNPHGTKYRFMLQVPYGSHGYGQDYICLLCHTRVGVDF